MPAFAGMTIAIWVISLTWQGDPIVHVEDDTVLVAAVSLDAGEVGASAILDGKGAQSERAHVVPPRQLGFVEHLAPSVDGVAGEGRRHVARAVQPENVEGVGQALQGPTAPQQ